MEQLETIECHGEKMDIYRSENRGLPHRDKTTMILPINYEYKKIPSPRTEKVFLGNGEENEPLILFGIDEKPFLSFLTEDAKDMYEELRKKGVKVLMPEIASIKSDQMIRQGDIFITPVTAEEAIEMKGEISPMPDERIKIAGTRHTIEGDPELNTEIEEGIYKTRRSRELAAPDHKSKKFEKGFVAIEQAKFHPKTAGNQLERLESLGAD